MRALRAILQRFLMWVGVSVLVLIVTGYWLVFAVYGGFAGMPMHVNLMARHRLDHVPDVRPSVFSRRGPSFTAPVDAEDWPEAVARHNTIRRIIEINLTLGILTVVIAAGGRFWS